jgi:SAM-dependent methyltransferase
MHDTALIVGKYFAQIYGKENFKVIDLGGLNVNGSLKPFFTELNMEYVCVDLEKHPSVDIVIKPYEKLPFDDASVDLVISTSCFEHDPCFWITFKEICRIVKLGGYIYINAPSNGAYHKYPGDNWRFYSDAGQALAFWASKKINNEEVYPVKVNETFHIMPINDIWIDFVCIFERINERTDKFIIDEKISENIGPLKQKLIEKNIKFSNKFNFFNESKIDSCHNIFLKYNSDKNAYFHNYSRQYEELLSKYRDLKINILELGVFNGCSLKIWNDTFKNANNIVGIDINEKCKIFENKEKNIYVEIGDCTNLNFLKVLNDKYGPFDIILDDASHINKDVITSFESLFPLLSDNGLYIVEDTICYKNKEHINKNFPDHLTYFFNYTKFLNQWRYDSFEGVKDHCVDPFKIQKKTNNIFEYSIDKIEYGNSYIAIHKKIRHHWIP